MPIVPILGIVMPKMGSKAKTPPAAPSFADALFTGTQQRVLALLFGQPARSFYANELISLVGMGSGAVQRQLTTGAVALRTHSLKGCKQQKPRAREPL